MKIALLGDVALIGKYDKCSSADVYQRLERIHDYIKSQGFDCVICNLEAPLTDKKKTLTCKSMHLRSPVCNIETLKYLGVTAVSLANNHMFDFGKRGLRDTIDLLEKTGIDWFGVSGKNLLLKNEQGDCVSVSGFCCLSANGCGYIKPRQKKLGVNELTKKAVLNQLDEDKRNNAYSIVSLHWSVENTHYPSSDCIKIARVITGVKHNSSIYGHHSHVLQGVQANRNGVIAYSLGNFIFDDCKSLNGKISVKQQEINKEMLLLILSINGNQLTDYNVVGMYDGESGIERKDMEPLLATISAELDNVDTKEYNYKQNTEVSNTHLARMGKHDLSWLVAHLNYYSIGARVMLYLRKIKYRKVRNEFRIK